MLQTAEKVDKKWGYLSSVRVPTLSFGSEILQKMDFFFFQFCAAART